MVRIGSLAEAATSSTEYALGFGLGLALGGALGPEATRIAQAVWSADPTKAVDPRDAAAIVAEDVEQERWGQGEAAAHGINGGRFDALVREALEAPAVGELLRMLRRKTIHEGDFAHGLRKAKLEPRWDAALAELEQERLDPAVIATAIQRGIIEDPGLLPVGPPSAAGAVPPMPVAAVDALREAEAAGVDRERLAALTRIVGLPPGAGELLQLVNRRVIGETDYLRGIAEGNTRNEWAPFLLHLRRRLLTPREYIEAELRGIQTAAEANAGAALSGMEEADARILFETVGRPLAVRAITTGLARGGQFGGSYADVPEPYQDAIRRSAIRPEYARLAYANRYTLPSAFVLRSMAQAGELTEAETHTLLLETGWPPALAKKVAARWAGSTTGAGKAETKAELEDEYAGGYMTEPAFRRALEQLGYTGAVQDLLVHLNDARRVKRYREKTVDAIAAAYVAFKIPDATASSELAEVGVTGEAATLLVALWGKQRRFTIHELTAAQVKKAYSRGIITRELALEALEELHYTPGDAAELLSE